MVRKYDQFPMCQSCGTRMYIYDARRRFCDLDCRRAARPCGIADCASQAFAGGLCQAHYRENRRRNRGVNARLRWFEGFCEREDCGRPWRSLAGARRVLLGPMRQARRALRQGCLLNIPSAENSALRVRLDMYGGRSTAGVPRRRSYHGTPAARGRPSVLATATRRETT